MRRLESQTILETKPEAGISNLRDSDCRNRFSGFIGDIMKRIKLTQGQYAAVGNEDYEWLRQHKWYATWNPYTKSFYAVRKEKDSKWYNISMAREILELEHGNKHQADHINHDTLDNRRANLRIVTKQQNQFNQRNPKGYYWNKICKKFHAQIRLDGKSRHLGYFHTPKDARNAYLQAKKQYHII